jgi:two-component system, OmpR family, sensor histidine kinase KdpD
VTITEDPGVAGLTGVMARVTATLRRARFLLPTGLSRRRQLVSAGVAVVVLTLLTLVLETNRDDVSLTIIFMLYLAAVVALSAAGGPLVGIAVAIVAFLLVNFFFTEPLHTLDVSDPERLAELIIFLAVSATVATLVDTAGRRRDVLEVRTAQAEQLAAANDLRTALLRAVSHDLRTPLTTAKLATSSLLASDVTLDAGQQRELAVLADREIDRLVLIVENLLDAGRLQAGVLRVDLGETDLSALVDRVITLVPEDERVRVANRVDGEAPTAHADRALLERVIANLVSNALNADTTHAIVVAADRREDGRIELDVIDHGPGLSEAQREAAFRPFHRFEDRGSTSGIGLGLPICAGFCEAMGAELDLEPTPGGGLTARVVLEPSTS